MAIQWQSYGVGRDKRGPPLGRIWICLETRNSPTTTPGYQRRVGTWLRDFSRLVPNLNLADYLNPYDKTQSVLAGLDFYHPSEGHYFK